MHPTNSLNFGPSGLQVTFRNAGNTIVTGSIFQQKSVNRFLVTDGTTQYNVLLCKTLAEVAAMVTGKCTIIVTPGTLGSGAALTTNYGISGVTVTAGGTGYAVGQVLTFTGGAALTVTTVNAGVITGVIISAAGVYTTKPGNPVTSNTGAATFTFTYSVVSVVPTAPGTAYKVGQAVTFTGITATTQPVASVATINTTTGGILTISVLTPGTGISVFNTSPSVVTPPTTEHVKKIIGEHVRTIEGNTYNISGLHADIKAGSLSTGPVQQNYFTSQDFTNAFWTKTNLTASAVNTLMETTTNGVHGVSNAALITRTAGVKSFFLWFEVSPVLNRTEFFMQVSDSTNASKVTAYFNLLANKVDATATVGAWTATSASVIRLTSGRYRCLIKFTTDGTTTGLNVSAQIAASSSVTTYAGDVTKGVKLFNPFCYNINAAAGAL